MHINNLNIRIKPVLMIIGFFVLNIFDIMYLELYSPDATFQAGALIFLLPQNLLKKKQNLKKLVFFFSQYFFIFFPLFKRKLNTLPIIKSTFKITYLYSKFFIIG